MPLQYKVALLKMRTIRHGSILIRYNFHIDLHDGFPATTEHRHPRISEMTHDFVIHLRLALHMYTSAFLAINQQTYLIVFSKDKIPRRENHQKEQLQYSKQQKNVITRNISKQVYKIYFPALPSPAAQPLSRWKCFSTLQSGPISRNSRERAYTQQ